MALLYIEVPAHYESSRILFGCTSICISAVFLRYLYYIKPCPLFQLTQNSSSDKSFTSNLLPQFRVICTRTGKKHSFSSPEAAAKFGGGINDWFGWRVDLSNPDIEVLLNIVDNSVVIGIALTKETRGKRNIAHFGPTTLKSSIAYCMLSLANIQPGNHGICVVSAGLKQTGGRIKSCYHYHC